MLSDSAPGFDPGGFTLRLHVGGSYTVRSLEQSFGLAIIASSKRVGFLTLEEP